MDDAVVTGPGRAWAVVPRPVVRTAASEPAAKTCVNLETVIDTSTQRPRVERKRFCAKAVPETSAPAPTVRSSTLFWSGPADIAVEQGQRARPRLRGAPEGLPFVFDMQTLSNGMNFTLLTDLGDIDLLGHVSGLGEFPAVALDAISMPLFGGQYRVASLDSLIRSKRAAGRNKDLNVLPELEALKEMHAPKEHTEPPQD